MKNQHKRRGILASAGALLTAAALALGGAATAHAAVMPESSDITITKLSQPPVSGSAATGAAAGEPGGPAIPAGAELIGGVTFNAYEVSLAGTTKGTNAWQEAISQQTAASAEALVDPDGNGSFTGAESTVNFGATNATTGMTTATDVPWGLYYVVEDATNASSQVAPAQPFLIAVPLTNPATGAGWLDHIYVYPKNSKVDAEKTVDENGILETGENFTWAVTSDVPRLTNDSGALVQATTFTVTDVLDSRLDYVNAVATIVDSAGDAIVGDNQLTDADYSAVDSSNTVTVTFNSSGLAKLLTAAGNSGQRVKIDITTTVNSGVIPSGATTAIVNSATITTNAGLADEIEVVTNDAQTNWSVASFTKQNSDNEALADASFKIFAAKQDAIDLTNELLNEQTSAAGSGTVTFDGLRTSDRLNGVQIAEPASYQVYWLRETVAPTNYQLLAEPIPVLLMADGKLYTFTPDGSGQPTADNGAPAGVAGGTELTHITNVKNDSGFELPLTGGMGTLFLTLGGLAILAIVLVAARRRRNAEASAE